MNQRKVTLQRSIPRLNLHSLLVIFTLLSNNRRSSAFMMRPLHYCLVSSASKKILPKAIVRGNRSNSNFRVNYSKKNSFSSLFSSSSSGTMTSLVPVLSSSTNIQSTLDPCVVLMKQLIAKYQHLWKDKGGIYSLAQGVVYWEPPQSAYDTITETINLSNDVNELHKYCPDEGLPSLLSAVKEKLEKENNLPQETTQVIITSGANQAYMNCILALVSPENESCIVFKPYYFNHVMAVQMTRGNDALCVGPVDDDGIPCVNWLRQSLSSSYNFDVTDTSTDDSTTTKKVKVVTITNPGNPTGVSIPTKKLKEIVQICKEYGVWLVMDNTYEQFDHSNVNSFPIVDSNGTPINEKGFHCFQDEHVINIFSFSKGYAMAGFRTGYVAVNAVGESGKDIYQQMLKVQDTIPICTSRLSQIAALGALSAGRQWVHKKVETLSTGRQAILDAVSPLDTIIGGSGAMYVMAKLPNTKTTAGTNDMDNVMDDLEFGERLVKEYGIAIIPGSFCGFPGWIRVCYSNLPPEQCLLAANRLAKGIKVLCSDTSE